MTLEVEKDKNKQSEKKIICATSCLPQPQQSTQANFPSRQQTSSCWYRAFYAANECLQSSPLYSCNEDRVSQETDLPTGSGYFLTSLSVFFSYIPTLSAMQA